MPRQFERPCPVGAHAVRVPFYADACLGHGTVVVDDSAAEGDQVIAGRRAVILERSDAQPCQARRRDQQDHDDAEQESLSARSGVGGHRGYGEEGFGPSVGLSLGESPSPDRLHA